jgi:hypothetical protein
LGLMFTSLITEPHRNQHAAHKEKRTFHLQI